jgi:signal transduction histidine kinase
MIHTDDDVLDPLAGFDARSTMAARARVEQERERLAEKLRTTQKWEIIGTLAGGIANEFNNMLTPILGFATLALDDAEPGDRIHKRLERILAAANRSRELAQQLMIFSRQEEPQRCRIRLGAVAEEALKLLRATLPVDIEIRHHPRVADDHILADADLVNQLLINLCTNAHHAMPEGGVLSIEITAVTDPEEIAHLGTTIENRNILRLTVRDTGTGMDAETTERAFEPFFTTKAAEQRSGLGLAVSRGIVANHGGALRVESAPGQGTSIHVYLPAAD